MRSVVLVLTCTVICFAQTALTQDTDKPTTTIADEGPSKEPQAAKDAPLLLLDDAPLLLLDDDLGENPSDEFLADNSRCEVCHLNLAMEELVTTHAREGIGCAECHGACDAHIDDESWASGGPGTPPDVMFPPERIDAACRECHETHDASPQMVIRRFLDYRAENAAPAKVVCTHCHGKHRLKSELRKAWWDKKTGKPVKPTPADAGSQ